MLQPFAIAVEVQFFSQTFADIKPHVHVFHALKYVWNTMMFVASVVDSGGKLILINHYWDGWLGGKSKS